MHRLTRQLGRDLSPVCFWALAVLLLSTAGASMFIAATLEAPTYDEPTHLTRGYIYLRTGNLWIAQENPALAALVAGLPLLATDPRLATEHESWRSYDMENIRRLFIFQNRVPPDRLLLLGRCAVMLATLLFGLVLAIWTRRHFGAVAATGALLFFALDPNILAHGHYAVSDLLTAMVYFFTCILWARYLRTGRWGDLIGTGIVFGAALATKHSMLFLCVPLLLLYLLKWWQTGDGPRESGLRFTLPRSVARFSVVVLLALLVVAVVYWPVSKDVFLGNQWAPMAERVRPDTPPGQIIHWVAETFHLPNHPYLMGFYWVARTGHFGVPFPYLLGSHEPQSSWVYYPVVFLAKTPATLLVGLLVCVIWIGRKFRFSGLRARLREVPFPWFVIAAPMLSYTLLVLSGGLNTGLRHLLPGYVFLFVLAAVGLCRCAPALAVGIMALTLAIETATICPDYLAFFNVFAGGSDNGPNIVVDSNLDWGQDLKKAKNYFDEHGIRNVCMVYFGIAKPSDYGINARYIPGNITAPKRPELGCVAAISATHLMGVAIPGDPYAWLRKQEPMERIGQTIYLYDFRRGSTKSTESPP